jgi:hypothetical protein
VVKQTTKINKDLRARNEEPKPLAVPINKCKEEPQGLSTEIKQKKTPLRDIHLDQDLLVPGYLNNRVACSAPLLPNPVKDPADHSSTDNIEHLASTKQTPPAENKKEEQIETAIKTETDLSGWTPTRADDWSKMHKVTFSSFITILLVFSFSNSKTPCMQTNNIMYPSNLAGQKSKVKTNISSIQSQTCPPPEVTYLKVEDNPIYPRLFRVTPLFC